MVPTPSGAVFANFTHPEAVASGGNSSPHAASTAPIHLPHTNSLEAVLFVFIAGLSHLKLISWCIQFAKL
jgi:hypothetical protein